MKSTDYFCSNPAHRQKNDWWTNRPRRITRRLGGLVKYKYNYRRALGGAHVPPTKLFPRLAANKTILKGCL